jgi:hypothetical protein
MDADCHLISNEEFRLQQELKRVTRGRDGLKVRVAELEREIAQLRSELAAVREHDAAQPPGPIDCGELGPEEWRIIREITERHARDSAEEDAR